MSILGIVLLLIVIWLVFGFVTHISLPVLLLILLLLLLFGGGGHYWSGSRGGPRGPVL